MDGQGLPSNGLSQRRKLVKKHPASPSAFALDCGYDARSIDSRRSSQSLWPPPRGRSSPSNASNNSSSPTYAQWSSNASPVSPQAGYYAASSVGTTNNPSANSAPANPPNRFADLPLRRLSLKASDDLLGAPFDGAAILSQFEVSGLANPRASLQRPDPPPPLKPAADPKLVSPAPRSAPVFSRMDASDSEKVQIARMPESQVASPKRFSDESKDPKPGILRKKSGLSAIVNSLVGSQKKPVISAPENPVHVTHVGYDSSTGQFTVR